jgi:hypothetical protein
LLSALLFIGELVLLHLGQIGFRTWAEKATPGSAIAGDGALRLHDIRRSVATGLVKLGISSRRSWAIPPVRSRVCCRVSEA